MAYLDYNGLKKHIELTKAYVNGKLAHYISQEQLSSVAVSGSYNDLTDKPDIVTTDQLSDVAVSGSYNDLTDKPEFSAEEDIEEAIAAHNSAETPHSNLFQIVNSGTTPVGLDIGGIYFELDTSNDEPEIGFCGMVFNGDSTNVVESESDLIKLTDTYFNYSN